MKKLFTVCAALVAAMSLSAENMTCAEAAAAGGKPSKGGFCSAADEAVFAAAAA